MNTDIFSFSLQNWALAASKLLQVFLPLCIFVASSVFPWRRRLYVWVAEWFRPQASAEEREQFMRDLARRLDSVLGFLSWKVGCDLGYFLLTGTDLIRALTPAGLIPYTVAQYLVYYLLGQKMVLGGMMNPFQPQRYRPPSLERRKPFRRALAKFLHEDLNATSIHVPLRRVLLKPMVDCLGMLVAWSAYNIGLFWVQSGEFNLAPLTRFPFVPMMGFYLGGMLSFIVGYNIGEFFSGLLLRLLRDRAVLTTEEPVVKPWLRSARWRLHEARERFSFRFRHLFHAVCGVAMVLALALPLRNTVEAVELGVRRVSFGRWGALDEARYKQIRSPERPGARLPDFSEAWTTYQTCERSDPVTEGR